MTLLWSLVTLHALRSPYWDMSTGNVAFLFCLIKVGGFHLTKPNFGQIYFLVTTGYTCLRVIWSAQLWSVIDAGR